MHEVLVNRLGGLSLPRKSVARLTDRPDMTLDVYRGRKTTMQQISDGGVCSRDSLTIFSLTFLAAKRQMTKFTLQIFKSSHLSCIILTVQRQVVTQCRNLEPPHLDLSCLKIQLFLTF